MSIVKERDFLTMTGKCFASILAAVALGILLVAGASADGSEGKQLFASKGCAACHGPEAEGKIAPALAGHSAEDVLKKARAQSGTMPVFSPSQLSDGELKEIAEFIEGLAPMGPADQHHLEEALEAIEKNDVDKAKDEMGEAIEKAGADRKIQEQAILANLNAGKVKEAEDGIKKLLGGAADMPMAQPMAAPAPKTLPNTGDPLASNLLIAVVPGGLALLGSGLLLRRRAGKSR